LCKIIKSNLEADPMMLCSVYHIGASKASLFVRNETYGKSVCLVRCGFTGWNWVSLCFTEPTVDFNWQCHITRTNADMHNPHNPFFFFWVLCTVW